MSEVHLAITYLINCFSKYAGKEGDPHTLSKAELKELLQNELGELLGNANDKAALDRIFKDLDANNDDSVDFREFGIMVFCIAEMCHSYFIKKK